MEDDMWEELKLDKFKCPYCGHEYERIVNGAVVCRYKGKYYNTETCINCGEDFLYNSSEYVKMPDSEKALSCRGYWIS